MWCTTDLPACPMLALHGLECIDDVPVDAETVDKYITVHSRDHKLTAGGKAAPKAEVGCAGIAKPSKQ